MAYKRIEENVDKHALDFQEALRDGVCKPVWRRLNCVGEVEETWVYWDESAGIWFASRSGGGSGPDKNWVPFGTEDPRQLRFSRRGTEIPLTIAAEINTSHKGSTASGGLFVENSRTGRIYVAHRGNLHHSTDEFGGVFGITQDRFFREYSLKEQVKYTTDGEEIVVISALDEPELKEKVADFVKQVAIMKAETKKRTRTRKALKDKLKKAAAAYLVTTRFVSLMS